MTLRVISKLNEDKDQGESTTGSNDDSTKKPKRKPPARTNKLHMLVKMAQKHSSKIKEEDIVLPEKPRFCSTLSPEAQFAMLKGYEDILLEFMRRTFPELDETSVYRVKTPHHKVRSTKLSEKESPTKQARKLQETPMTLKPGPHTKGSKVTSTLKQVDEQNEDQLRISYRFNIAMTLIDELGDLRKAFDNGNNCDAASVSQNERSELDKYNTWIHKWSKEFQFELPEE